MTHMGCNDIFGLKTVLVRDFVANVRNDKQASGGNTGSCESGKARRFPRQACSSRSVQGSCWRVRQKGHSVRARGPAAGLSGRGHARKLRSRRRLCVVCASLLSPWVSTPTAFAPVCSEGLSRRNRPWSLAQEGAITEIRAQPRDSFC